jgi:hypothetical protein
MANIVITKSGNSIIVDFGDYSSVIGCDKRSFDIRDVSEAGYCSSDDFVDVMMRDSHGVRRWVLTWDSSYSGSEKFIVDSVDGVAPTSQSDLFDKVTALR